MKKKKLPSKIIEEKACEYAKEIGLDLGLIADELGEMKSLTKDALLKLSVISISHLRAIADYLDEQK